MFQVEVVYTERTLREMKAKPTKPPIKSGKSGQKH